MPGIFIVILSLPAGAVFGFVQAAVPSEWVIQGTGEIFGSCRVRQQARLHCWSRQRLDGLGSAHLLLEGRYKLPPQLKTHLSSSKTTTKERIFL